MGSPSVDTSKLPAFEAHDRFFSVVEVHEHQTALCFSNNSFASVHPQPELQAWRAGRVYGWLMKRELYAPQRDTPFADHVVWVEGTRTPRGNLPAEDAQIRDAIAKLADTALKDVVIEPAEVAPGGSFPRIWSGPATPTIAQRKLHKQAHAANVVRRSYEQRLREIFDFVSPDPTHYTVHSDRIRELLSMACMEVESGLKATLLANSYPQGRSAWTMRDYVKLVEPMGLDCYSVQLSSFPHLGPFEPFSELTSGTAPDWYRAYNTTKHDRETKSTEATLRHVINAVAACFVLLHAQFGPEAATLGGGADEFFVTDGAPTLRPGRRYIPSDLVVGRSIAMCAGPSETLWKP